MNKMNDDTVIKVEGVSKKFCRSLRRSMFYGVSDSLRSMVGIQYDTGKLRKQEFWAIDDISFELKRGEILGIIGVNGSGKSTLLRLINGIFPPDRGRIFVKGRVGALIAVGAGFHPHMTGRENIYLNGTILGLTRKEIDRKYDEIVDFAEIGDFLESPVATYSSGMKIRLGFSIAINCEPEILLIDEILSVGDLKFRQKSLSKISEYLKSGVSTIYISHNMQQIQMICSRVILLDRGKIAVEGKVHDVVGKYYSLSSYNVFEENKSIKEKLRGKHNITYRYIKFFDSSGKETRKFNSGEDIHVEWAFNIDKPLRNVILGIGFAIDTYTDNAYTTDYNNIKVEKLDNNTVIKFILKKPFLSPGLYHISLSVWDVNMIGCYFWDFKSTGNIEIVSEKRMLTRFMYDHEWKIVRN